MSKASFGSFEELGEWELAAKGGGLHVVAEIGPDDDGRPAIGPCRMAALRWVERRLTTGLPRRAHLYRSFDLDNGAARCRAVRERSSRGDLWGLHLAERPGTEAEVVTELVVAVPADEQTPTISVGTAAWPIPAVQTDDTLPPRILLDLASEVPLLQGGAPLAREPEAVWTPQRMQDFIAALLDPGRQLPVVAITEPTLGGDPHVILARSRQVARALTGLATVTVLPQRFTYTLSDTVTKPLSVYDGAWRVYLPGFDHGARRFDHPVYLRNRVETAAGLERTTREVLRVVAGDRVRARTDDGFRFDSIRPTAQPLAKLADRIFTLWRRLAAFARQAATIGGRILAPAAALRGRDREMRRSRPSKAETGIETPRAENAEVPAQVERKALLRDLDAVRADLHAANRRNEALAGERDRYRKLQAATREERDEARRDVRRLEGLVRLLGGDPGTSFPIAWEQLPAWCATALQGRVVLADPVRRDLGGALFEDVGLAAVCLHWLGHEYREARLRGGDSQLLGPIRGLAGGIRNQRCGGDSFDFDWRGERYRVAWHLKNGGNTRDPRRCLRIYYFWDAARREVVIASMPAHRRSAIT
ncbi:hypothetical protein [Candidatus Palauibacter sp.]|uniref:hypothetical protein n=1 Tax=Candidatus Palauibacter sp. TaxID=3101350 RepID=UPI003D0A0B1C